MVREDGSLPTHEWQQAFAMLSAKVEQMNLLINEMLETARLEEGGPITNLEPVDLRDIIRRAAQTMELLPAVSGPGHHAR